MSNGDMGATVIVSPSLIAGCILRPGARNRTFFPWRRSSVLMSINNCCGQFATDSSLCCELGVAHLLLCREPNVGGLALWSGFGAGEREIREGNWDLSDEPRELNKEDWGDGQCKDFSFSCLACNFPLFITFSSILITQFSNFWINSITRLSGTKLSSQQGTALAIFPKKPRLKSIASVL